MNTRLTCNPFVAAAAALAAATLPGVVRAQSDGGASDPIVVKARETVKAVAAAAATPPPASTAVLPSPAPSALAASSSPAASSPSPSAKPAASGSPAPSPAVTAGGKIPATTTTVSGVTVPAGAPVIIVQAAPAPTTSGTVESTANNWVGGLIGMGLLGAAGYFGVRAARNRGITFEDGLKRLGIETQPAMPAGPSFAAMKPAPTPMPPLPSLSELPIAGPAASAGIANSAAASARRSIALVGVAGPVSGERFALDAAALPFSVGRDDVNSLALTGDVAISRRHAQIVRQGSDWTVGDLGSSNGTFVNGARVKGQQPLRAGDEIQIGGSRFRFEG